MAKEGFKRKLTAVLSADAVGYSRLMAENEAATVKTIAAYRGIMSSLIEQHRGRVVDSPGDNILAEFSSVVDAVQCAVDVQKEFQTLNAELAENRRMDFLIGINLGDVIEEEDRIYGDGVNIAARLEGLAEAGGICISGTAFDQVKGKLSLGYKFIGKQTVKNIPDPIRAYKVLVAPEDAGKIIGEDKPKKLRWALIAAVILIVIAGTFAIWKFYFDPPRIEITSVDKKALPLPEKPSIAVLSFDNMSDDPEQEYFSDGISEDIITDLSKISRLIVIARNSSFAYKGKSVNVQQIGQDLKVRYLLEGSVRKAGDQVRINAQLIDASNGQHLWAERYDGKMDDIFALQDKITRKIISALTLKLTAGEQKALTDRGTDNLQAYDEFLKGWQGYRLLTSAGFAEAKIRLNKAVELDPEFSRAYAALAVLYWKATQLAAPELRKGLGLNNRRAFMAAKTKPHFFLKKAMKKPTALAHGLMSKFYLLRYQHDEALAEIEQAVAMDPNDPELYTWMSEIYWLMGENSEAIESAKLGLRLDPNNPTAYLRQWGKSNLPDGDLQESLQVFDRALRLNPELSGSIALNRAIIYGIQGRDEESRTAYEFFLKSRMTPVRNLNDILLYFPFRDPKKLDRIAEALIKAGVPGKLSDYYRIFKENRIKGQEVKSLLFGHKITGTAMSTGKQLWYEWTENGKFKVDFGSFQDEGKSWVEGDVFFLKFKKMFRGLPFGTIIYRNPDGSGESKNQYFMVSDLGSITPFAPTE
jgi:adenylate cyclase